MPAYAFIATFVLLKVIGAVMPLRGDDRDEALGMDLIYHGEEAYATGEGAILVTPGGRDRGAANGGRPGLTGAS